MIHNRGHIELVRDQMGHASITTTQRYAHLYPAATQAVTALLDAPIRAIPPNPRHRIQLNVREHL